MFPIFGGLLSIATWRTGTNTTIMPVIKADLEAVVIVNPRFCAAKPRKRNVPRSAPRSADRPSIGKSFRRKSARTIRQATVKRMAINRMGEISSIPSFRTVNVPAHITVVERRAISALDRIVTAGTYSVGVCQAGLC